jgi:hypothetical protein
MPLICKSPSYHREYLTRTEGAVKTQQSLIVFCIIYFLWRKLFEGELSFVSAMSFK